MDRTIVVGYDGSEHAKRALERASELVDGGGLVVVEVSPFIDPRPGLVPASPVEFEVAEGELAGP